MGTQDVQLMAHLLRRAGFGATRQEIEQYVHKGYQETVEELPKPSETSWIGDFLVRRFDLEASGTINAPGAARSWIYQMVTTTAPLQEKMPLFWHSVFATGVPKVINGRVLKDQISMFRKFGLTKLDTMLLELSRDPAMIVWLDNQDNHKEAVNENFGRELLELFSMGVGNYTEEDVFVTNVASMWNVCRAAEQLKIRPVVLGSSYNAVGAMGTAARWAPREVKPPEYFPLDQHVYTRSEEAYSIAKWVGEEVGQGFARRNPWMSIASMRFNGMWTDEKFRALAANPIVDVWERCQGFWTYLHIKDAAVACVLSIESEGWTGHHRFFLNAADTMIDVPTMDAIAHVYPDVPLREKLAGFRAPISTANASELIGWSPAYSWRDEQFKP